MYGTTLTRDSARFGHVRKFLQGTRTQAMRLGLQRMCRLGSHVWPPPLVCGKRLQVNFKHMCRVQNFAVRWITGGFRGTPIGAMELISGIPPCNLLIVGYAARIMTLPPNHLLRQAWQMDVTATRLRHFAPKRRPRHLPSDSPLERLKAMGTADGQMAASGSSTSAALTRPSSHGWAPLSPNTQIGSWQPLPLTLNWRCSKAP